MQRQECPLPRNQVLIFAVLSATVVAGPAIAAPQGYKPEWSGALSEYSLNQPNQSFLDQVPHVDPLAAPDRAGVGTLISPELARNMEIEYRDMTREYEIRERYDQVDPRVDRKDFMGRVEKFAWYVVRRVFHFQVQEHLKEAEKNSEEVRTFKAVNDQVQAVAKQGVSMQMDENFQMGTKADLKQQVGRIWMKSAIVNGTFEVEWGSPVEEELKDPAARLSSDRYRLLLNRPLPVWGIQSGLTYGLTTTVMAASLSKQLYRNLSVEFASIHKLDPDKAGLSVPEQTLKFSYGIRF